jgi:antagonist of KipI
MSLQIIRAGLLDTVQDRGRYGYAELGIPAGGAMDSLALSLANSLAGNDPGTAALECYFPAPRIRFLQDTRIALAGADFSPCINGQPVPMHTPILVRAGAELHFTKRIWGAWTCLAVGGGLALDAWLGSYSTNLVAAAGGWNGRALRDGDVLPLLKPEAGHDWSEGETHRCRQQYSNPAGFYPGDTPLRFCPGPEHDWMTPAAQQQLETERWRITTQSNRMGYRMDGAILEQQETADLLSAAVLPGTIQLLPDGRFIVLMADAQTTGGYPRIGQLIRADLPRLAQMVPGETFRLERVAPEAGREAMERQRQWLQRVYYGVKFNRSS